LPPERERIGAATCGSAACHEAFVKRCERDFGPHKRVADIDSGRVHLVPVRDIIERGVKGSELERYPEVEPTPEEARELEGEILRKLGMKAEVRDGQPGVVVKGLFIPALEPSKGDILVCSPKSWGPGLPGSTTAMCSECGQDIVIAPSGQEMLRQTPMRVICLECMAKKLDEEKRDGDPPGV
jgi:hypothetical protein